MIFITTHEAASNLGEGGGSTKLKNLSDNTEAPCYIYNLVTKCGKTRVIALNIFNFQPLENYELRITNYELRITNYELRIFKALKLCFKAF